MARKKRESSFWVSYSDLSTGLMIVFLIVMVLMIAVEQNKSTAQQESVKQIVSKLEVILGQAQSFRGHRGRLQKSEK